jgi:hypothetical protein
MPWPLAIVGGLGLAGRFGGRGRGQGQGSRRSRRRQVPSRRRSLIRDLSPARRQL